MIYLYSLDYHSISLIFSKGGKIMGDIKYNIEEKIAVLSEKGAWTKELNRVSWNDRPAKYDLRDWNHEDGKMRKGITLSDEECEKLKNALIERLD